MPAYNNNISGTCNRVLKSIKSKLWRRILRKVGICDRCFGIGKRSGLECWVCDGTGRWKYALQFKPND